MTYKDWDSPNWRDDCALANKVEYRKKWALRPVLCSNNDKVWLRHYYAKYRIWSHLSDDYSHTDFVENITEAEYIVRKLSESL